MSSESQDRPPTDPLAADLRILPGASPTKLELLARLGLRTVGDLLFHFPRSYEDLTDLRPIAALAAGLLQTAQGEVVEIEGRHTADGGCVVSVVLSDDGRTCLEGVWFNQAYAAGRFRYGQRLSFSGKPKWCRDHWQMSSPRVQVARRRGGAGARRRAGLPADRRPASGTLAAAHRQGARPVRRPRRRNLAGGLKRIARLAGRRARRCGPSTSRRRWRRPCVPAALHLRGVSAAAAGAGVAPPRGARPPAGAGPAGQRRRSTPASAGCSPSPLTADQDKAVADVRRDLAGERPMQRLLQADVGAGKTAVAVYALLVAVANKHQAALMAPTEVLARQHCHTLERYLAHSRVRRLLLTGGLTARERREALEALRTGEDRSGGRHAGAGAGGRAVRPAGAGGHRRAAQVRRPPAGAVPQARRRSALPRHDGDADPADGGAVGVRRPGRVGDAAAAAGPPAGGHALAAGGPARRRLRPAAQGARGGSAGLPRLPAGGGVGDARRQGSDRDARGVASRAVPRLPPRPACTAGRTRRPRTT